MESDRSNVWALESLLQNLPASGEADRQQRCIQFALTAGTFLTFAQFLYVTVQNVGSQVSISWKGAVPRLHLRKRQVPLRRWMVQVVLFLGVSLSAYEGLCAAVNTTLVACHADRADHSQQLCLRAQDPLDLAHHLSERR